MQANLIKLYLPLASVVILSTTELKLQTEDFALVESMEYHGIIYNVALYVYVYIIARACREVGHSESAWNWEESE